VFVSKIIIKIISVVFMENNTIVKNNLEMCPSGRNEGTTMVVGVKYPKSSSYNDGDESDDQMRKQSKYPWKMTTTLRDLAKMGDILSGSGICPENGRKITFYPNMAKNMLF
jgi:hypothetical protein